MKKIYNFMTLLVVALMGLSLTACSDDDLSTNQYAKGIQLNVYGPNPVMRGGVLRFIGTNLEQISQVVIPGCDPITNFEVVKSGTPSEIRVTVPKDGPEVGYVKLIASNGTELTTKTQLEYEEPIIFDKFSPASVMPGDELTIEGDYLNLVQMVCFNDDVWVSADDFVSHDRYKIVVVVPEEAQTGVVGLYTMDLTKMENPAAETGYNIIESEKILEVGTPSVSKFASSKGNADPMGTITAKAGETITISGNFFSLAKSVEIVGEQNTVTSSDITISEDGKTITFSLPTDAPDGQLNIICKSGVEVPVGSITTVAPDNLKAEPSSVKNGAQIMIKGNDLDLISEVHFPNVADAVAFELSDGTILAVVPETAQEGDISLKMVNGKEVTVAYTLVKPVVTAYRSNPVNAGGVLTLVGTDLDLVQSITFGEATNESDKFEATETSITVTVPMAAASGVPVLNLKNGTTVDAIELSVQEANFCYATTLPSEEDEIKAGNAMTITVANGDVLTQVQINGETCQHVLTGEEKNQLIIGIPTTATKSSTLTLISSNGEISYTIAVIPATSVKKVLFSGLKELTWNDGGRVMLPAEKFEGVPEGALLTFSYSQIQDQWGCLQMNYGDWSGINFNKAGEDAVTFEQQLTPTDIYGWFSDGILNRETTVVLTEEIISNILAKKGNCEDQTDVGIIIQGQNIIVSNITLSYENVLETTIWTGNVDLGTWSINWTFGENSASTGESNTVFADMGVKAGQTLRIYGTPTSDWWQVQLFDGHWGGMTSLDDTFGNGNNVNSGICDLANGCIEINITDEMANLLTTYIDWGYCLIIQGENFVVTKITVE